MKAYCRSSNISKFYCFITQKGVAGRSSSRLNVGTFIEPVGSNPTADPVDSNPIAGPIGSMPTVGSVGSMSTVGPVGLIPTGGRAVDSLSTRDAKLFGAAKSFSLAHGEIAYFRILISQPELSDPQRLPS